MTQKDKNLLLKDLCARLPYGVKVRALGWDDDVLKRVEISLKIYSISIPDNKVYLEGNDYGVNYLEIDDCLLYLRPISSMTDEEMDKLFDILKIDKDGKDEDWIKINDVLGIEFFFPTGKWVENVAEAYDYLYSIHIDFRGLIPMGLALEASEGMYE